MSGILQALVAGGLQTRTVILATTGAASFIIPLDFGSFVSVEAIGGGGSGSVGYHQGGPGGGAYAKSTSVTGLAALGTAYVSVGTSAADTWFNAAANAAPTTSTEGVLAKGGTTALSSNIGQAGGAAASCIGDVVYSGGAGSTVDATEGGCGGGGGAAGPGGVGGAGGAVPSGTNGGAGGEGADLTTAGAAGGASTGAAGGNGGGAGGAGATSVANAAVGTDGTGGGGGGGYASKAGASGGTGVAIWKDTYTTAVAGPGGGGGGSGGSVGADGGVGGLYGGAGGSAPDNAGAGAQGVIVFVYKTA